MAALRKENGELNASMRQLLTRVPHSSRQGLALGQAGQAQGVSREAASPLLLSPIKPSHAGARAPSTEAQDAERRSVDSGGRAALEAELAARHAAMIEQVQQSQGSMVEMHAALRQAEEGMRRALAERDDLREELRRLQADTSSGAELVSDQDGSRVLEKAGEGQELERQAAVDVQEEHARDEHKVERLSLELARERVKVQELEKQLGVAEAALSALQAKSGALGGDTGSSLSLERELCSLLDVPAASVVAGVRQLIHVAEQVGEVKARACDAALAIQILAKVEEALGLRIDAAVTGQGASPSAVGGRRARGYRSDPEEVVNEVEELVAFEKRWLTDALVNSDAKSRFEVSYRAIAQLQSLVEASDPDDTLSRVTVDIREAQELRAFLRRLCSLLQCSSRDKVLSTGML